MSSEDSLDPCGEFGPTQRWALVWFFGAVALGAFVTVKLATFDRSYYDADGYVLDYDVYAENRGAFTSVGTERVDPRSRGSYPTAVKRAERR